MSRRQWFLQDAIRTCTKDVRRLTREIAALQAYKTYQEKTIAECQKLLARLPSLPKHRLCMWIGAEHNLKAKVVAKVLDTLVSVATAELKETGKFNVPGVLRLKTRMVPATKARKKEIFGKTKVLKAKTSTQNGQGVSSGRFESEHLKQ